MVCLCTGNNPIAKGRGLSSGTDAQTLQYMYTLLVDGKTVSLYKEKKSDCTHNFDTYRVGEQRRLRPTCTSAQSHKNIIARTYKVGMTQTKLNTLSTALSFRSLSLIESFRYEWFINPFKPNGMSHSYQLDPFISVLKVVG